MTLREYLQNPFAMNPQKSLYTMDGTGVSRLHRFLPEAIVDGLRKQNRNLSRKEELLRVSQKSNFVVMRRTDKDPPRARAIPDSVQVLYHCNLAKFQRGKIRHLPIGRDFRSAGAFQKLYNSWTGKPLDKPSFVYANFGQNTHVSRPVAMKQLRHLHFVDCVDGVRYLNYPMSRDEYAQTLAGYRFVICPRGNGRDTYRFWDSLCCGCIPIVPSGTQPAWNLPFIEIRPAHWHQLTQRTLEQAWEKMLDHEYSFELLLQNYWIEKISTEYRSELSK